MSDYGETWLESHHSIPYVFFLLKDLSYYAGSISVIYCYCCCCCYYYYHYY